MERAIGPVNRLEKKKPARRRRNNERLEAFLAKKKAKTHYHGIPEDNNQEFAEAALGSLNTTPSCEILEHHQPRNLKRPAERTKSLETCSNGNSSKRDGKQCGAQQSGNVKDEQSALSGIVNLHHKQDKVRAPWTFEKDKGGASKDISLSDEKASRVKTDRATVLLQNDAYEEQKSCSNSTPKQCAFHGSNSEV